MVTYRAVMVMAINVSVAVFQPLLCILPTKWAKRHLKVIRVKDTICTEANWDLDPAARGLWPPALPIRPCKYPTVIINKQRTFLSKKTMAASKLY